MARWGWRLGIAGMLCLAVVLMVPGCGQEGSVIGFADMLPPDSMHCVVTDVTSSEGLLTASVLDGEAPCSVGEDVVIDYSGSGILLRQDPKALMGRVLRVTYFPSGAESVIVPYEIYPVDR